MSSRTRRTPATARTPSFTAGATLVAIVGGLALLGLIWTPHDSLAIDSAGRFASPSGSHPLGTDQLGRDVLSNIIDGARTTLLAGILASGIAMTFGASLGVVAAASRRWIDDAITVVATVFVAFPALLLALVLVAVRGPSTDVVVMTVGIAAGASVVVVTRRDAADILRSPFVLAARFAGGTTPQIVFTHVLRNLMPSLVVQATSAASIAIVAESTLSYLGLGTTPPTPSWGRMLASTQQYLLVHPLLTLWPALFICLTVVGVTLLGDGLRERFDSALLR
jgi:peptide/nickel transport system permease protein